MEVKEKAKWLINAYRYKNGVEVMSFESAVKSALIAADDAINSCKKYQRRYKSICLPDYWKEVKKEVEKHKRLNKTQ